jgi:hypothetical protein
MTGREWQHSFFMRDRWTPTGKLTLDLGLRYELYPIMHRADGRGVDRLDLSNPDFNRQLDVLIAGRGGNPQNGGMEMSWDNIAPRLGAVYRIDETSVFRAGYGLTYNATPWARAVRGDNDYPITIAASYPNVDTFGFSRTLAQGIPTIVPLPLDRSAAEYTPEPGNVDRGYVQTWNIAYERRLPFDISADIAYVGAKGKDGYAALDINAPAVLGTGNQGRPYFSLGRIVAINSCAQQAVHARAAVQGRIHPEQVYERERQRRAFDADLEHAERAGAQLGAGRVRSPAQLPDGLRLLPAVAEQRRPSRQLRSGDPQ